MTNFADRTIWTGDNLDILRGINSASVGLIYLEPPFNSNRNYAAPVGSANLFADKALFPARYCHQQLSLGSLPFEDIGRRLV